MENENWSMKCRPTMMLGTPALELLLLFSVGLTEAAPSVQASHATPSGVEYDAVSQPSVEASSATIPNHLPEDRDIFPTLAPTPVQTTLTAAKATPVHTTTTTTITTTTAGAATPAFSTAASPLSTMVPTTARKVTTAELGRATAGTPTSTTRSTTSAPVVRTTASPATDRAASLQTRGTTSAPAATTEMGKPEFFCNCSVDGAVSLDACNETTGQCECEPGYTGLQCEDCGDGYFSNGTTFCLPCACDSFGAVSSLCDSSGICTCKTGVYGPKCDECKPGYFSFSTTGCRPCQCNNHSSDCHPQSGTCVNCQDNTQGPRCEECKYSFYRRPGAALTEICEPCPCSPVTSTGSCHIDSSGQPVCDQCRPEYQGPNCDKCRDGYYNSDSICARCECSGNVDPRSSPRVCDPDTGQCLNCANNTAGRHCEKCAEGYSGDGRAGNCTKTVRILPTAVPTTTPAPPTSTMTSSPNTTTLLTTATTQALATTLNNTTTATEVSWTQFNIIILAVIIVVVVVLMGFVGGVYMYREYQNRKLNAPFWTIELKEDNISFSSYHDSIPNADVSGLLEDEASEVAPNGQLSLSAPMGMYKA
ncbi:multiple epidermal growth factor-like domains protein 9 isoform X2 [Lepisosteus oculatus]|uniref:multiple epidermal growth factor-like domains protein 9 isoform X2 n=1 Tax=Lepisosteus oculatus TaxID=7918 RepID=UPI0037173164